MKKMSGLLNSQLNGSASNFPESTGRPLFTNSFSAQSATAQGFHPSGLHNVSGSFNIPNMSASLASRNVALSGVPSSGVQQPAGSISGGRFASNNLPVALSQISHGGSHGVTNRGGISIVGSPAFSSSLSGVGGSLPGISSNSVVSGNRNSMPGLSTSPILGNVTSRTTNSLGNMVNGGSMGRSIGSSGVALPALASRGNFGGNIGSGSSLSLQGTNRLMGSMLQQAPQMLGMLGNSYPASGGLLSQNHLQAGNSALASMGMLNDANSNDSSPFDMSDFPQLAGRPSSSGGPQGQLGSLRKQGISSIVQHNQEFSIQNEDFPALPGFKGGSSDFSMDLHQKEQLHETVSMLQSQHFPMGRSVGFNLGGGGTYASARQQQQQLATAASTAGVAFKPGNNQDLLHLHGSELFSSSNGNYQSQVQSNGLPSIGFRPSSSPSSASSFGSYDQNFQQYQHAQNQSQQQFQQMSSVAQSYRDQSLKSLQASQTPADRFGLLGLLSVIRMSNPDLTSLALGMDLTTLGLNLNSSDDLHKKFGSPWSNEPLKGEPECSVPACYYAKQPPPLQQRQFSKFQLGTLFYIFYSMPKDEAQIYAAYELYLRGWFYHKEAQLWLTRVPNMEPLVKTHTYERGAYFCFDPNTWETIRKENFVVHYESVERKPTLPAQL